ncbi:hypothetical protein BpHYR1_050762 [Brachionus plicatilis]|uniref:Uncharacterized protein n=1 Tax=Brachionus plicatilis TaxID=10195 RepID=A0A3M7P9Q4_BRAPC|nr:hypothetical protein BpHYR1_050762 [Brachionus plicatilis]
MDKFLVFDEIGLSLKCGSFKKNWFNFLHNSEQNHKPKSIFDLTNDLASKKTSFVFFKILFSIFRHHAHQILLDQIDDLIIFLSKNVFEIYNSKNKNLSNLQKFMMY